jgi:hypothetical protein
MKCSISYVNLGRRWISKNKGHYTHLLKYNPHIKFHVKAILKVSILRQVSFVYMSIWDHFWPTFSSYF